MQSHFRVGFAHPRLSLLDGGVQRDLAAFRRAVAAQTFRVEEGDMLAHFVFQPDNEIGVIGIVIEERYAPAACQVADQEQLPSSQAGVGGLSQLDQSVDDLPLVAVPAAQAAR